MRTVLKLCVVLSLAVIGLVAVGAGAALAHEERDVGPFHVAVGFGQEPAYAGQENSVQMFINDANDKAVTDLGDTLKVEISYQDQTMPAMTMQPNFEVGEFGIPGDYRAFFFPTRPGSYGFHFTGSIKAQNVDETFTSGPDTFSDVEDPSGVQFPVKDPTTGQLAERLDRELPRVTATAEARATAARDRADGARTLAVVGIVLGGLGLVVGAAGLVFGVRRRRT
jgi:hypothetical protein